ncbi:MAG TPA: MFS transporter, partial [Geminicoccaceae bacterium]|nr:MFS transporter [Geminicoccaceae bacterium]
MTPAIGATATALATGSPGLAGRRARVVLGAGAAIVFIALGLRHSFGLFLEPMTRELGVGREVYGFAIALQNLLWGLGQPVAGVIADRFGSGRVVFLGGLLYGAGLAIAATGADPAGLHVGMGVLVGLGLSATSYAVVLGAVGRHFPPERRTRALGMASVGGSLGIFASVPATLTLIGQLGWAHALLALAALVVGVVCLLSVGLAGAPNAAAGTTGRDQSLGAALVEAGTHRGYLLLVLGFFVCGFQLAFIATHLPAYLVDRALPPWVGGTALAVIGAANVVGTLACGALGDRASKKRLLAGLYVVRAAAAACFLCTPITVASVMAFAAVIGLTWLGTVPLTSGIVAQVFGPRYLATLVGVVFLMHQVGSFLGAWLGGHVFDRTGSYDAVWWIVVLLGL